MQLKIILKQKEGARSLEGKKKSYDYCLFIVFTAEQKKYSKDIAKRSEQHTREAHENQHTHWESIYLGANAAGTVHSFN